MWLLETDSKQLCCTLKVGAMGKKERKVRGIRMRSNFQNDISEKMQILEGEQARQSPGVGAACLDSRKARSVWAVRRVRRRL